MSADRELLELAAKAAGIALYWAEDDPECDWVQGTYPRVPDHKILEKWTWKIWNPLTDDGDALRLAVKLEISFQVRNGATWVKWAEPDGWPFLHHEVHDGDPHAATRRVIVRAAAEIGRSLPASAHDACTLSKMPPRTSSRSRVDFTQSRRSTN